MVKTNVKSSMRGMKSGINVRSKDVDGTSSSEKFKTQWIEINADEIMKESYKGFEDFLKKNDITWEGYENQFGKPIIYLKLKIPVSQLKEDSDYNKGMGEWVYYNPINLRRKEPNVSTYDLREDFSNKSEE